MISVEIGEGGSEFHDVLQCFDKLKLARSERGSDGAVSGCQSGYCGLVSGSGSGQICYGVNGFLLVELGCVFFLQEICGVKFSAGCGDLGFSPFVVSSGEESF